MNQSPEIDARDMLCPLPVLRLRKVLLTLPPGKRVRMIATDTMTLVDVPHFCSEAGHVMISVNEIASGLHEFVVEKGAVCPLGRKRPHPRGYLSTEDGLSDPA